MKNSRIKNHTTGRREFLTMISAAASLGVLGASGISSSVAGDHYAEPADQDSAMPTITLGRYRISRLICGSNPLLGYSYMGAHTDRHMKEYFTPERTVEMLLKCEKVGITAHQFSSRMDYIPLLRDSGSKLKLINLDSQPEKIDETIRIAQPIAMVHHGGVTDRLFADGKADQVHDYVKRIKDKGLLAGVSAHNPDNIRRIADEDWENDFFMTCFYYLTRKLPKDEPMSVLPVGSYNFYRDDPKAMTAVVRQVKKPCLGFKILGAGRQCSSEDKVRAAFKFAFDNIKPTDGVIVGMFPWYFDEMTANAQYARELGKLQG
jgi:hypothetical protein